MPFQFYCPQGHLLEGHEAQQGIQGSCPMCGSVFTFPTVAGGGPAAMPGPQQSSGPAPAGGNPLAGLDVGGGRRKPEPQVHAPAPKILAILCPNGHTIQAPEDLLGTTSICPYCNKPVELRHENTAEYRRQMQAVAAEREAAVSRFWIRIAAIAVVLVVATFVAMFFYIFKNR